MKKKLCVFAVAVVVAGCRGLDEERMAGIDQNNNALRDDIDAYVTRNCPDPKQRKAYLADNKALDGAAWTEPEGDNCE